MNIVTFATPVSVAPPKLWIVSLYTNTMTRQAFLDSNGGVLQLLSPAQKHLVPLLGKRSGYEDGYSKETECEKAGYRWTMPTTFQSDDSTDKSKYTDDDDDDGGDTATATATQGDGSW